MSIAVKDRPRAGRARPGCVAEAPGSVNTVLEVLESEFTALCRDCPKPVKTKNIQHLATLGTGNHFIEVGLD